MNAVVKFFCEFLICFLTVPPTLVAEVPQMIGTIGDNATLIFTLNEDINPPIDSTSVYVSIDELFISTQEKFQCKLRAVN